MSEFCDANELAQRLGVTKDTIHAWHRRGWIPCLRAGRRPVRFDAKKVIEALEKRGQRPQGGTHD
jgi:excisionase family DNA binding protein